MQLREPYATRPIRPIDVADMDGWRVKVYGIAYGAELPSEALVEAALALARIELPAPAVTAQRYGVGFLGIHQGRGENFVFLDWWAAENELHHHVWFSPQADPTALRPATPADPIACAWDLALIAHERTVWTAHVLANPAAPDLDAYLLDQLSADV